MNSSLVISTGCKKQQTKQCRFNTMKVIFTCLRFAYIWNSGFLTCKTQNILMLVFCRGSELPIWWLKAEALIVSCTFRIVSRQFKVSSLVIRPFKTGNRSPLLSSGNLLLLVNFPRNYHVIRSLFENNLRFFTCFAGTGQSQDRQQPNNVVMPAWKLLKYDAFFFVHYTFTCWKNGDRKISLVRLWRTLREARQQCSLLIFANNFSDASGNWHKIRVSELISDEMEGLLPIDGYLHWEILFL